MSLRGNLEHCDGLRLEGWVFDPEQPTRPVRLEIRADGAVVGHVVADRQRQDLAELGDYGDGRCGFAIDLPIRLSPGSDHAIEVCRADDGAAVPGSPVTIAASRSFDARYRAEMARMLNDTVAVAGDAGDLDTAIKFLVEKTGALLDARARRDAGDYAAADIRARWGELLPTPAVREAAPALRPQALFVDENFPAAGESGGANAVLDHMRSLARLGFEVSFVAQHDLGDRRGVGSALSARGIRALTAPWYGSIEEILSRRGQALDLVYLHRGGTASAYGMLVRQACRRARIVYSVADLHHLRLARQQQIEDRPELRQRVRRARMQETVAARLADVVITHSPVEADLLRRMVPGVEVAVVPWSVSVRSPTPGFAERSGVAFIGSFTHEPNLDAAHYLTTEILPLVRAQDPSIGFRVIGSHMPPALHRLARPGLELVGQVDDLDAALDAVRLTVAPLRFGAGLKSKVIDSLAAGVPCVGTTIAYEGMAPPPEMRAAIADPPAALADALLRLYRDERLHAACAEAGRRFVRDAFSEERIDGLMRQVVAPVLRRWAGLVDKTAS